MNKNIQRELETALDSGSSYEALQLLKSLLFRSSSGLEQDASACDLFKRGIKQFVEDGNSGCALDLCKAFVESLSRRKDLKHVSSYAVEAMKSSIDYMRRFPGDRSEYLKMLLKWAVDNRPVICRPDGSEVPLDLHQMLGQQFLTEGDESQGFYHLVRSNDAEACAECVLKLQNTLGYPSEFDLFAAQVILQLLVLKHVEMAESVYGIIVSSDAAKMKTSRSIVMFNFLDLLIQTCKKQPRSAKNFELLVKGYARVYDWDPVLEDYVKLVGQHLFGIAGRGESGSSGFLAEAMRNLLSSSPLMQPDQNGEDCVARSSTFGPECREPT